MVKFYLERVKKGKNTLESVPKPWRDAVTKAYNEWLNEQSKGE